MDINLIYIMLIISFIHSSGFIDNIKELLPTLLFNRKINAGDYTIKPFDCSLCSTFWLCFIYTLFNYGFNLHYFLVSLILSYLSDVCVNILNSFKIIINESIFKITSKWN